MDVQGLIITCAETGTGKHFGIGLLWQKPTAETKNSVFFPNKNKTQKKFTMKFLFSAVLLSSLSSSSVVVEGSLSSGNMDDCGTQAPCLKVTVVEYASKCSSDPYETCEYEVCWEQLEGNPGTGCYKNGHVDYICDMHKYGDTEDPGDGGCVNELNEDGKGFWDTEITDPSNTTFGYSSGTGYDSRFKGICQVVSPGHTAHILINDGERCGTNIGPLSTIMDATGKGLAATCLPSTSDSGAVGGQTYFPVGGQLGGTCSDIDEEGYECVWSITVPQHCEYEEHDSPLCPDSSYQFNQLTICQNEGSILEYYPNDANPAPPGDKGGPIIHDLKFIDTFDTRTVSFRAMSPYTDMVDVYTVYHSAVNGDSICNKDESIKQCPSDVVMEAKCFEDDTWTVVTVFVAGYGPDSQTAGDVIDGGTEIYECCNTTFSPIDHTHAEYITGYTYLIRCKCESEIVPDRRVLQVSEDLSRRFLAGELFDEELKTIYGLN
jgi:hypothetical protein